MSKLWRPCESYGFCIFVLIMLHVPYSLSGVNNMNMHEGVTTPYIIGGDVFFEIVEPSQLRYTYRIRPATNFGGEFNESFCMTNTKLVVMEPIDGCTAPDNQEQLEGNVAFAVRGECSFLHKTLVAERAGARALIVTEEDNLHDPNADLFIEMVDDKSNREVNIPVGFLLGRNGAQIQNTLEMLNLPYALINIPVNMTFVDIHRMNQPPWTSW